MTAVGEATVTTRAQAEELLLKLLPVLRQRMWAELPTELSSECITPHQGETLSLLRAAPAAGLTMNELARAQGSALSTATAMVDRLIRLGLAERLHDEEDRRVVRISITPQGRDLTAKFRAAKRRVMSDALSRLDDDDVLQLAALMRKLAAEPRIEELAR